MRTLTKNIGMFEELFEHFYNQKSLLTTIGRLLEELAYRDTITDLMKTEIEEILNLVWVADTGTKQIDKIMDGIFEEN